MKQAIQKTLLLLAAAVSVMLVSCKRVQTEATAEVTVYQDSVQAAEGIMVYRFSDELSAAAAANADDSCITDTAGTAYFEFRSPADFARKVDGETETSAFYFCT